MPSSPSVSFVIPVYNERESLRELHSQIDAATKSLGPVEILFIDDGSKDGSWDVIDGLAKADLRVKGVRFRRNFGKAAALSAGFVRATGETVFTLDADLQDDPAEIPKFLAKLGEGYDVVSGWKKIRHDPWHKVFPSRVFNAMVSRTTGIKLHDHNCGFKAYRKAVLPAVAMYGERHRFVPVLAAAAGFRVGEVVIKHRKREFGKSKYGLNRFVRGFLDLQSVAFVTRYRFRPMHSFGSQFLILFATGVVSILFGLATLIYAPTLTIGFLPVMLGCMALLAGLQFYLTGLLAETRLDRDPPREPYSVVDTIGTGPNA
jgi:glycosyltransferase involved in cell wall biosynthesis